MCIRDRRYALGQNIAENRLDSYSDHSISASRDFLIRKATTSCLLYTSIIFQDASFEISINDVTQEEEQVRLKRQLTQNIAHELKTPVSSIQDVYKRQVQR